MAIYVTHGFIKRRRITIIGPMEQQTRDKAARRAYELGYQYEGSFGGCAQCVIAALQDSLELRNPETDAIFKAATGLAGGGAQETDGSCGAYAGGSMIIGHLLGRERDNFADPEKIRHETSRLIRELHGRFIDEFGNVVCRQIHTKIMGRPYYIKDPDELEKFNRAGGHDDKCTRVAGLAAQWTAEILIDEGLIDG